MICLVVYCISTTSDPDTCSWSVCLAFHDHRPSWINLVSFVPSQFRVKVRPLHNFGSQSQQEPGTRILFVCSVVRHHFMHTNVRHLLTDFNLLKFCLGVGMLSKLLLLLGLKSMNRALICLQTIHNLYYPVSQTHTT